jgi:hypothetical protein
VPCAVQSPACRQPGHDPGEPCLLAGHRHQPVAVLLTWRLGQQELHGSQGGVACDAGGVAKMPTAILAKGEGGKLKNGFENGL